MNCDKEKKLEKIKNQIKSYPDFPKPGILFRDIFSVLRDPPTFRILIDLLIETTKQIGKNIEHVVALDARGFLFGPLISLELNVPFVPVRKQGKLPGEVEYIEYVKEYGKDYLGIQKDSVPPGAKVLIVDDLLATGGSLEVACKLVRALKGEVVACLVVMELEDLKGRKNVPADVVSLIKL